MTTPSETEIATEAEALRYLTADGSESHLLVPCSRYGGDCGECAPVAWRAALAFQDATGEPLTADLLDQLMSLVVNDHDDIAYLLGEASDD